MFRRTEFVSIANKDYELITAHNAERITVLDTVSSVVTVIKGRRPNGAQKILRLLWYLKPHHRIHKNPLLKPILGHMKFVRPASIIL